MLAQVKKHQRVVGATREKLAEKVKKEYEKGKSIRSLSDELGRSYGFVHRLLSESGVSLRGRGGAVRAKTRKAGGA